MGGVLVGVRAANLFHGFEHHRFSATTQNTFLKVDLDVFRRSIFHYDRGVGEFSLKNIYSLYYVPDSQKKSLPDFVHGFDNTPSKLRTNHIKICLILGSTSVFMVFSSSKTG